MSNPYAPPSGGSRPAGPAPGQPAPGQPGTDQPGPSSEGPPSAAPPPGPQAPGTQPSVKTPKPPPDPEAVRAASRRVLHFGLLMLAALLTGSLPVPWQAAGLVFGLAAVVMGFRALHAVWRAGVRGALVPILVAGLFFAGLMTMTFATMLILWPLQMERQDCLRDALTISASEACERDFQSDITERLGGRPADTGGDGSD